MATLRTPKISETRKGRSLRHRSGPTAHRKAIHERRIFPRRPVRIPTDAEPANLFGRALEHLVTKTKFNRFLVEKASRRQKQASDCGIANYPMGSNHPILAEFPATQIEGDRSSQPAKPMLRSAAMSAALTAKAITGSTATNNRMTLPFMVHISVVN